MFGKKTKRQLRLMKGSPTLAFASVILCVVVLTIAQFETLPRTAAWFGAVIMFSGFTYFIALMKSMQTKAIWTMVAQGIFYLTSLGFVWILCDNLEGMYSALGKMTTICMGLSVANTTLTLSGKNAVTDDGFLDEDYLTEGRRRSRDSSRTSREKVGATIDLYDNPSSRYSN